MNNQSEASTKPMYYHSMREKYFDECTIEQKLEHLRYQLVHALTIINEQSAQITKLTTHSHSSLGTLLVPMYDTNPSGESRRMYIPNTLKIKPPGE